MQPQRVGIPSSPRARVPLNLRRPPFLEPFGALVAVMLNVVLTDYGVIHPPWTVVRSVVGACSALFAPGVVAIWVIYPKEVEVSRLLRWALVVFASVFFDIVLALVLSVLGLRLDAHTVAYSVGGSVSVLWALSVWRCTATAVRSPSRMSVREFVRTYYWVPLCLIIPVTVVLMLAPNYSRDPTTFFLTSASGRLGPPIVGGTVRRPVVILHIRYATPHGRFHLQTCVNDQRVGGVQRIQTSGAGTWSEALALPQRFLTGSGIRFKLTNCADGSRAHLELCVRG
jgi:hypothetical protein